MALKLQAGASYPIYFCDYICIHVCKKIERGTERERAEASAKFVKNKAARFISV
jgi:hypothetical protein